MIHDSGNWHHRHTFARGIWSEVPVLRVFLLLRLWNRKTTFNSHLMKGIMEINVLGHWAPEARARANNTSWQFHMVYDHLCGCESCDGFLQAFISDKWEFWPTDYVQNWMWGTRYCHATFLETNELAPIKHESDTDRPHQSAEESRGNLNSLLTHPSSCPKCYNRLFKDFIYPLLWITGYQKEGHHQLAVERHDQTSVNDVCPG